MISRLLVACFAGCTASSSRLYPARFRAAIRRADDRRRWPTRSPRRAREAGPSALVVRRRSRPRRCAQRRRARRGRGVARDRLLWPPPARPTTTRAAPRSLTDSVRRRRPARRALAAAQSPLFAGCRWWPRWRWGSARRPRSTPWSRRAVAAAALSRARPAGDDLERQRARNSGRAIRSRPADFRRPHARARARWPAPRRSSRSCCPSALIVVRRRRDRAGLGRHARHVPAARPRRRSSVAPSRRRETRGVVVLSHGYWHAPLRRRSRHRRPDLPLVDQVNADEQPARRRPARVIGVMPPDFVVPVPHDARADRRHARVGRRHVAAARVRRAASRRRQRATSAHVRLLGVVGRAGAGRDRRDARAELAARARQLESDVAGHQSRLGRDRRAAARADRRRRPARRCSSSSSASSCCSR